MFYHTVWNLYRICNTILNMYYAVFYKWKRQIYITFWSLLQLYRFLYFQDYSFKWISSCCCKSIRTKDLLFLRIHFFKLDSHKNSLNLRIKTEPVTVWADATVFSTSTNTVLYSQYIVALLAVTCSVFMRGIKGLCHKNFVLTKTLGV